MSIIETIVIDNLPVEMVQHSYEKLKESNNFNGQKILHPFETKEILVESSRKDKKGKIITRTLKELVYTDDFVSDSAKHDIENAISIEMKHDGACGFIMWNDEENKYIPYARYDIKKNGNNEFKDPPIDGIACEPKPTNSTATHWPHFVPCVNDKVMYKWNLLAFEEMLKCNKLGDIKTSFTCEYMGKKFNYKKSDGVEVDSAIVPHGLITLNIPVELRTMQGFKKICESFPFMEGLIIHGVNNIWKLRRDAFYDENYKHKKLEWPNDSNKKISEKIMLH